MSYDVLDILTSIREINERHFLDSVRRIHSEIHSVVVSHRAKGVQQPEKEEEEVVTPTNEQVKLLVI